MDLVLAEEAMTTIWSEVLGLQSIGVDDDFFELGGDSMHCIQIVSAARGRGMEISPRDLFANPTISGLAPLVRNPAATETLRKAATATAAELSELSLELGFS